MKFNWLPAVAIGLLMVSCTSPATRADKAPAGPGMVVGKGAPPSETGKAGEFQLVQISYDTGRGRFRGEPRREVRRLNRFLGIASPSRSARQNRHETDGGTSYTGVAGIPGGLPGVESNIPGYQAVVGGNLAYSKDGSTSYAGVGGIPGGVPGVESNIPGYQAVVGGNLSYAGAETYKFEALKYDVEKGVFSGTPQPEVDRLNALLSMTRSEDGVPVR